MSILYLERTYRVTLEQALALHTTPLVLEPARPGYAYQAVSYAVVRPGPQFATQSANVVLRTPPSPAATPPTPWGITYTVLGSNNWLTKVDVVGQPFSYIGYGTNVGGAADGHLHYGSKPVEVAMGSPGTPLTATEEFPGSDLTIVVQWRLMPTYAENA
jgi:hypothetical protein